MANWEDYDGPTGVGCPEAGFVTAVIVYALQDAASTARGKVLGAGSNNCRRQTPENLFKDMESIAQFVESDILWNWSKAVGLDPVAVGNMILQVMHGKKPMPKRELSATTRGGPAGRGDYAAT